MRIGIHHRDTAQLTAATQNKVFKSHQWKLVDISSPAYPKNRLFPLIPPVETGGYFKSDLFSEVHKTTDRKAELEQSTSSRWWDSEREPSRLSRLDLNNPPVSTGGIQRASRYTHLKKLCQKSKKLRLCFTETLRKSDNSSPCLCASVVNNILDRMK